MTVSTKFQIPSTKQTTSTKIRNTPLYDLEDRTLRFAEEVIRFCKGLSVDVIDRELVSQLIRASSSIGANYREANEALSRKDFGHRIRIARREAKETGYWLKLLAAARPESHEQIVSLLREAVELRNILSAIASKSVTTQ